MAYEKLAYFYDDLMEDMPYFKWTNLVKEHVKGYKFLDVASGTGLLTLTIQKLGYDVTGLDISPEMVDVAIQRTKINHELIDYSVNDMRTFNYDGKFDGIGIFVDSINYLLDKDDIKKTFENVYNHLVDDGVFIFDSHTYFKLHNIFDGYSEVGDLDDFSYTWASNLIDEFTIKHDFKFMIDNEIFTETHIQRIQTKDDYLNLLNEVGFSTVEIIEEEDRIFFVMKKEK